MKKRHSIKARVTGWYASFLVLMVIIMFCALGYISHDMLQRDIKENLTYTVNSSLRDINVSGGELHIDNDITQTQNNIHILVYTENNFVVTGSLPAGVNENIPFIDGSVRVIKDDGNKFYVYDRALDDPTYRDVWVRGITSANLADADPAIAFMAGAFLVGLPLLILLACIGGYLITRRAFRPVSRIAETASSIEAGGDLSKRIGLDGGSNTKDEIYMLSSTFDSMLGRLQESFEAEKQFSNDASHELRTPLSVIMSQCEYALKNTESAEAAESFEVIYDQSKKMSSLTNKLLMIARADRGVLKPVIEDIDVSELTSVIVQEQEMVADEKDITIKSDIEGGITAQVDESMFIRIWNNLISNSIKYTDEGGLIEISLKSTGDQLVGIITDNGIGISEEDLPKIWNRFYRADPARSSDDGAGLGLSIVKLMIERLGGTITAKSVLGEGTEMSFTLPLIYAEQ